MHATTTSSVPAEPQQFPLFLFQCIFTVCVYAHLKQTCNHHWCLTYCQYSHCRQCVGYEKEEESEEWSQVVLITTHLSAFVQNVYVLHFVCNSLVIQEHMSTMTV